MLCITCFRTTAIQCNGAPTVHLMGAHRYRNKCLLSVNVEIRVRVCTSFTHSCATRVFFYFFFHFLFDFLMSQKMRPTLKMVAMRNCLHKKYLRESEIKWNCLQKFPIINCPFLRVSLRALRIYKQSIYTRTPYPLQFVWLSLSLTHAFCHLNAS